jgi:hypothetical protein
MLLGTMVPVGGQPRGVGGDIRGHIRPLSPRGPLTMPLPPLILPKEGEIASSSSVILQERCRGMTPGFRRLLGHMVSKRFVRPGYHPTRSLPGFHLATAYNLDSQSRAPSTGCGQGFHPTSGSQIPSGQRG